MITFYSRPGGSQGFQILSDALPNADWLKLKNVAIRLLKARNSEKGVELLSEIPFYICHGTNYFHDEFYVLFCKVSIDEYVALAELKNNNDVIIAFKNIARTFEELDYFIRFVAVEPLTDDGPQIVPSPELNITTSSVALSLRDAEQLLYLSGAINAVDRAHTALHGYLRLICEKENIHFSNNASITELFKELRSFHPLLRDIPGEMRRVIGSLATIVDSINYLRNQRSIAHPNNNLLSEHEALLAVNCCRAILSYLDGIFN